MKRNIFLLHLILPTLMSWFWLGIWVLYYLKYTNYAGIGLIEMAQITFGFLLELPSGVVADLIGKKKTLFIAFLLITIGNIIMAGAFAFPHLVISVIFLAAGYAFSSGTVEALLYDSLKQLNKQQEYSKISSRIEVLKLCTLAGSSIIGGLLYVINPRLPYVLTSVMTFFGLLGTLFLLEPKVDSQKYVLSSFFSTLSKGLQRLLQQPKIMRRQLLELGIILLTVTITYEVLDGALAIEFGLTEAQLGIFFALLAILAALATYLFERFSTTLGSARRFTHISYLVIMFTTILSPFFGKTLGSISLLIRNLFYPYLRIRSTTLINHAVDSKYRATTLSTYTLFTKAPYLLAAYFVGSLIDRQGASAVASKIAILSLLLFSTTFVIPVFTPFFHKRNHREV